MDYMHYAAQADNCDWLGSPYYYYQAKELPPTISGPVDTQTWLPACDTGAEYETPIGKPVWYEDRRTVPEGFKTAGTDDQEWRSNFLKHYSESDDAEESFWKARPEFTHIRDFARARLVSPWAVLGCVLARVSAATPHHYHLPAIVGGKGSLNYFVGLVGPSGAGKGAAYATAREAVKMPPLANFLEHSPGSGEGLITSYVSKDSTGRQVQHNYSTFFTCPEVSMLGALKGRQGSTLLPLLCQAWSGELLATANADPTKNRVLEAHDYRLAMWVGVQPGRADILLSEASGGAPQRFVFLPVNDPDAEEGCDQPDPMQWHVPWCPADGELAVYSRVAEEIRQARLDVLRGNLEDSEYSSEQSIYRRLKTAALMGLLNGRSGVNMFDWIYAGYVEKMSRATLETIRKVQTKDNDAKAVYAGTQQAKRNQVVDSIARETKLSELDKAKKQILSRLESKGPMTRGILRNMLSTAEVKEHFQEAIDGLIYDGVLIFDVDEKFYIK